MKKRKSVISGTTSSGLFYRQFESMNRKEKNILFEEIAKIFPNLMKTNLQIQDAQQTQEQEPRRKPHEGTS